MPLKVVAIAGSFNRPSKTFVLVETIAALAAKQYGLDAEVFDLADVGPSLGQALWRKALDAQASAVVEAVVSADVLIIGSPTYKGSYPGLFKHLIDLIEPQELRSKPIVIAATGGGDRHALIVEHQLRPLFGFFAAHTVPTAVYASDRDFLDYKIVSPALTKRIAAAVDDLAPFVAKQGDVLQAAE